MTERRRDLSTKDLGQKDTAPKALVITVGEDHLPARLSHKERMIDGAWVEVSSQEDFLRLARLVPPEYADQDLKRVFLPSDFSAIQISRNGHTPNLVG